MATRIDPDTARADLANHDALLVCAYDSVEKLRANWIDGAMSLYELEARSDTISPDQEIIFYCA